MLFSLYLLQHNIPQNVAQVLKGNKNFFALSLTSPIHIPPTEDCSSTIGRGRQIFSHIEVLAVSSDIGQTYQKLVT